jgi:hypothetical protein
MNQFDDPQSPGGERSRRDFFKAAGTLSAALAALPLASKAAPAEPGAEAPKVPQIKIGDKLISRVICGSNPFLGLSHLSRMIDIEFRRYYTPEQIVKTLQHCQDVGINTWAAGNFSARYVHEHLPMQFFCNVSGDRGIAPIDEFKKMGLIGVNHHGGATDPAFKNGKSADVKDFCKKARDKGVLVGVCSHIPEVLETIESEGWDVDHFMCCVYQWGRNRAELEKIFNNDNLPTEATITAQNAEVFVESDPPKMFKFIKQSKKPCLAYKILAGGRKCERPALIEAAFKTAFESIKPTDAVIVGMYDHLYDHPSDNAEFARKYGTVQTKA